MSPAFDYRPPFVNPEFLESLRFNTVADERAARYNEKPTAAGNSPTGFIASVPMPTPPLPQPGVQSALHEGKVFLVWKEYGGEPTHKHDTLASAEKEADRLARLNPGAKFYVLSTVESVVVPVQPKPAGLWRSAR